MLASCDMQYSTFRLQRQSLLQRRFDDILSLPEYVIATVLDPKFNLVPFEQNQSTSTPELTPVQTVSAVDARSLL